MTDEERKVWDEMVEFAKRPPSPVYSHLTIYNNRTILAADAELTRLREYTLHQGGKIMMLSDMVARAPAAKEGK